MDDLLSTYRRLKEDIIASYDLRSLRYPCIKRIHAHSIFIINLGKLYYPSKKFVELIFQRIKKEQ